MAHVHFKLQQAGSSSQSLAGGDYQYVVAHEYRARFAEDLELARGERVCPTETADPDWWHGYKAADRSQRLGLFPATCVTRMHAAERLALVVQNVSLCSVAAKPLRLYRDQVSLTIHWN